MDYILTLKYRLPDDETDLAGLTDVAQALGLSRQNLHKPMNKHRHSFPVPLHEGGATIWHLADVQAWLQARGTYQQEPSLIDVAQAARHIHLARAAAQKPPLPADMSALFA